MTEVFVRCKRCGAGVPLEPEEKELLEAGGKVMARCSWCGAEALFEPHDRWFLGSPEEIRQALDRKGEL